MANLSRDQLKDLAVSAGFTGSDVDIAVAVALAESGGNPNEHNSRPPDDSWGLWQINMFQKLGPERRKKFGISKDSELADPKLNAKAAKMIHGESGWKAWSTYTTGRYKQFMRGSPSVVSPTVQQDQQQDLSWSQEIAQSVMTGFNSVGSNIFKSLANFAWIGAAITLLVAGVLILSRNVIPLGRVAKLAKTAGKL